MRIIICELKKIWTPKILGIITLICALFYITSMHHQLQWYQRGTWADTVDFAHHLTENYGAILLQEDFEDFLNYRDVIVQELDLFIASNQFFSTIGIYNFNDYENFRTQMGEIYFYHTEEQRQLWIGVALEWGYLIRTEIGGETVDIAPENEIPISYARMIQFGNIVGIYHTNIILEDEWPTWIYLFMELAPLSERESQRLIEIRDSGELLNIMTQSTMRTTWEYGRSVATLIILVTLVLVSPLIVKDRTTKVNWLQYSSKQGRSVLKKQLIAIIISAVIITTIIISVFAGIFSTLETWAFWNNGINSFMSVPFHWLSITYGQYVLLIVAVIYLLSVGTAVFAFVLSRYSQNMVRLMFKIIPLFVATQMLSSLVLTSFLAIFEGGNVIQQTVSLLSAFVVALAVAAFIVRNEKRVEIV